MFLELAFPASILILKRMLFKSLNFLSIISLFLKLVIPNFDLNLNGIEILTRLIFLYSNPEFEYFITFQHNKYIDQEYIKTIINELESNKSFILNNKIFATCREFIAYNGFNFNNFDTEEDQSIEDVHNLTLAMTGLPVNNKIFLLALKDVLPVSEIVIDNLVEPEISKFLFQINVSSEEKIYAITDLDKFDKSILTKKDMILLFTKQKNNFTNFNRSLLYKNNVSPFDGFCVVHADEIVAIFDVPL